MPLRIKEWLIDQCQVLEGQIIELDWFYSSIIRQNGNTFSIPHREAIGNDYYQNGVDHGDDDRSELGDTKVGLGELCVRCVPTQHFSGRTLWYNEMHILLFIVPLI